MTNPPVAGTYHGDSDLQLERTLGNYSENFALVQNSGCMSPRHNRELHLSYYLNFLKGLK